ncbi:MAG: hypothetical protein ABS79_05835 [Planctomycetes bacterium SCN 63-9]|nr:MAG: hypothetical protein ABS79_05835 [Planctomycetes bacterium SCN 63-9]
MIVPNFWAEYRARSRSAGKQVTVRRHGWSMESEAEALRMAKDRAEEALGRILVGGEKLDRREPKVPYNGSDGFPIREEVLARYGEEVITRNAYGAHCLNTPRALFADIDLEPRESVRAVLYALLILTVISIAAGFALGNWRMAIGMVSLSLVLTPSVVSLARRFIIAARGGVESLALRRLHRFLEANPSWSIRLYRTPAGYRLLATHRPFEAAEDEVRDFFAKVDADPVYIRMCRNQRCFRARLTAKPWRIGISAHMRPRPGVWPVDPDKIAIRNEWITAYEARAASFAACRYLDTMGSGIVHESLRAVIELHDRRSGALDTDAPIA